MHCPLFHKNRVLIEGLESMNDVSMLVDDEERIQEIVHRLQAFSNRRENLIPVLQMIQQTCSYLSPRAIECVAAHLRVSVSEIYGVATFYNQFRFHPPGRHQIKVCLGTACHVVGGDIILENFERKLGIRDGETTPDREFGLERVACVGCCALAPVAVVDDTTHGHMAPSKVEGILLGFQIKKDQAEREGRAGDES
jgi:NADH-quinone oxidoreductase subunit E